MYKTPVVRNKIQKILHADHAITRQQKYQISEGPQETSRKALRDFSSSARPIQTKAQQVHTTRGRLYNWIRLVSSQQGGNLVQTIKVKTCRNVFEIKRNDGRFATS